MKEPGPGVGVCIEVTHEFRRRPPAEDILFRLLLLISALVVGGPAVWARMQEPVMLVVHDGLPSCCCATFLNPPAEHRQNLAVLAPVFEASMASAKPEPGEHRGFRVVALFPLDRPGAPGQRPALSLRAATGALDADQRREVEHALQRLGERTQRCGARSLRGDWAQLDWLEIDLELSSGVVRPGEVRANLVRLDLSDCVESALAGLRFPSSWQGRVRLDLVRPEGAAAP